MKHTFHLFTTLFLLLLAAQASAQLRFGVKAGLNLATVSPSSDLDKFYEDEYIGVGFTPKILPSFHLGVQGEYDFSPQLGIGLGLQLNGKGYKVDESFSEDGFRYNYTEKITPLYLQVPLTLNFHKNNFFAAIGPYVAFGLTGKYDVTIEEDGDKETFDGKIAFENDFDINSDTPVESISPFDVGASLELGYEFGNIRLSASYNLGLANIYPSKLVDLAKDDLDIDNFKASHRVIGISAAYMFGSRGE